MIQPNNSDTEGMWCFEVDPGTHTVYMVFDPRGFELFYISEIQYVLEHLDHSEAFDFSREWHRPDTIFVDFFQMCCDTTRPQLVNQTHCVFEYSLAQEPGGNTVAVLGFADVSGLTRFKALLETLPQQKEVRFRTPSRGGHELTTTQVTGIFANKSTTDFLLVEEIIMTLVPGAPAQRMTITFDP